MNITITGRHLNVSESLKEYAEKKINKLEKYFHQLLDAHVILYMEKVEQGAEVIINGDGVQFHGREKTADLYSSIDLLFEKMERQIVKYKEKHSSHKAVSLGEPIPFRFTSDEGRDIRLNQVSNKPIDKIEAFLQMKNDQDDFILFKKGVIKVDSNIDYSNKSYAVIYKGEQNCLKMIEIPFEKIKEQKFEHDTIVEYELNVIDDSIVKPNIEFKRNGVTSVEKMTLVDALEKIEKTGDRFLPFFNVEAQYFNVIYKSGKEYEVMVPAF
ncbi:MAG: ribosome-associated translation inhibitor RaiA [bacterium]|nr:ribosome-associated translation inhibitor RaiA [bacterium]